MFPNTIHNYYCFSCCCSINTWTFWANKQTNTKQKKNKDKSRKTKQKWLSIDEIDGSINRSIDPNQPTNQPFRLPMLSWLKCEPIYHIFFCRLIGRLLLEHHHHHHHYNDQNVKQELGFWLTTTTKKNNLFWRNGFNQLIGCIGSNVWLFVCLWFKSNN